VLQTRINGLLGLQRRVIPTAPASDEGREAAAKITHALEQFPRLDEFLHALLDGISKGFAVIELIWNYTPSGQLAVEDWIAHRQEAFAFNENGELMLLSPPFQKNKHSRDNAFYPTSSRGAFTTVEPFSPPPRKFIAFRFGADARHPYGRGLTQRSYWYYWFKKNVLKFWAVYNEKYGSPTAVAKYGPGTSEAERQELVNILDSLQTESGLVVPESVELTLLEQGRGGNGSSYREFLDWCNDEMSKIALGATLTSGEGRRSGSLALGSIHQLVRKDYIDADARLLERCLNGTLLKWLCEINLGTNANVPKLQIETNSPEDLRERVEVDKALLSIGVSLPQSYFYEQYGRPAPEENEHPLQFDDANFYGYHIQYGILTINEIRQRLNLPPVPWGNQRTSEIMKTKGVEDHGEDRGNPGV
jgi:phage gp29-like protein